MTKEVIEKDKWVEKSYFNLNNPNIKTFVYIPSHYEGAIAIDAKIEPYESIVQINIPQNLMIDAGT
jgi:TFIIF-interacting CTD phosphatase-like protein